jgi:protein-S-isoprenylcysteine O-methyltransferase Ste14
MSATHLFVSTMFIGVGLLAIWVHLRFPRLQARTLSRAFVHIGLALGVLQIVSLMVGVSLHSLPRPYVAVTAAVLLTIAALCYVLLSWIWLLVRLRDRGLPRGGHPVSTAGP